MPVFETLEKKALRSLFMTEEGSDMSFRVGGKIFPAHKQILNDKSKYYANLFQSKSF